ncbi:uncharacterized protein LOC119557021 [Drosophila subpulchrella]|uniref:uncharacterized protein LOC119557021 n=1 Tax=Drosophila subpulchrella TaxID=1486046 RepID=UPI0018A1456F|nr:uncharacterized protein LOC119557021 [Drosophila subpulchrella]
MSWANGLNNAGKCVLLPQLRPWQRFEWRSSMQSQIYRDWGVYYTRRLLNREALESFGRAVAVCREETPRPSLTPPTAAPAPVGSYSDVGVAETGVCRRDYKSLFLRGRCQRSLARPDLALLDVQRAQRALQLTRSRVPGSAQLIAEKCDNLFEANKFENALTTLLTEGQPFGGQSAQGRFRMIKEKTLDVFEDTLGESLRPFMHQHSGVLEEVSRRQKKLSAHHSSPPWKTLRDGRQCDVQSVHVREPVHWTPLEKARQRANQSLYNHNYMGRNAVDIALLRQLRSDRNFLDPLRIWTTPSMRQLSEGQYAIIRRFMKMLQARNPLYNRRYVRQRKGAICEQERQRRKEMHLFHKQYQTRRDCMRMLQEVHRFRREGDVDRLSDYVEHIMSGFIGLKTQRTLPWKWELLNDVYNTVAMAYCDRCSVPANVDFLEPENRPVLYLLRSEKLRDMSVRLGGPNIYLEIQREEERHSRINQKLELLESRLRHSRYPIERSYLLFEMARCHFKESRFEKCLVVARKVYNEARSCNCLIWRFNSIFLGCQVHAVLNRFERLKETLAKASQLASDLKAPKLVAYIGICINVNNYELAKRKMRQTEITIRKVRKRSPVSTTSASSQDSSSSNL